jgi:molybdate transport system substrate-binding protein
MRKPNRSTAVVALVACAFVTALLVGCVTTPASPTAPAQVRVSAASSLEKAFEEMAPAFESANHARLVFDFGASGVLQKQIEGGAPADVFASASPKQVDALVSEGLVSAQDTVTIAGNDLVIFVPRGNPADIHGPADLGRARRLTTGDPSIAPHGAKAQEWLTGLKLWQALLPKFVFAENAAQTLDYVARGEVDAGIGFASEARGNSGVEVVYTVPRGAITPVRYILAPLRSSSQAPLARRFIDYVLSPAGLSVLRRNGFLAPPAPAK